MQIKEIKGGGGGGDPELWSNGRAYCIYRGYIRLKSRWVIGASHHTAFMGKCSTVQFVIFNP